LTVAPGSLDLQQLQQLGPLADLPLSPSHNDIHIFDAEYQNPLYGEDNLAERKLSATDVSDAQDEPAVDWTDVYRRMYQAKDPAATPAMSRDGHQEESSNPAEPADAAASGPHYYGR
jgi:hypothetical protein